MPSYAEQNQQLTEARRVFSWLGAGSVTVQQQALRDFHQAMSNWRAGTHRRPAGRKRGRNEGFRIVGAQALRVERVNRRWSRVLISQYDLIRIEDLRVVDPAFTSQRCSGCGHVDANSRQSQALFVCTACGMTSNADRNAARNIAAGQAVTAREACRRAGP